MYGQIVARNIPVFRSALPAGWVMSSAEDMGKWLTIHLNDGYMNERQIIPATDIEEVHTTAVMFEENGEEMGYGMGWFVSCEPDNVPYIWHGGDTPSFTTDMILLPEHQLGVVMLVNSQASTIGHSIAPGVINLILGIELEPIAVPWWAHWKVIDTIATVALVFIALIMLALVFYIWLVWRQFRDKKRHIIGSSLAGRILPARKLVSYITPLVMLIVFALVGYMVVQAIYGYNFYEVLFLFRLAAPPGVWLSGIMLISTIILWVLLLAFVALFTRGSKAAT
jgi:CubicO group peptidase (beta-lactamase class C family)